MNTHTLTPWSYSGITGDHHIMHKGHTVAIVTGWPGITDAEFEANKQFIVTACNVHDALVAACELVERAYAGDGVNMSRAVDACLQALALAKPQTT